MTDTKEKNIYNYKKIIIEKLRIDDYYMKANATNLQYTNWLIDLDVQISNKVLGLQPVNIEFVIYDEAEERLLAKTKMILKENESSKVNLKATLNNIKTWSDQSPNQYNFKIVAKDEKDNFICEQSFSYGFRTVEVRNRKMFINGNPVMLNGVVYNDYKDKCVEELVKTYYEDIKILKKYNINTVITYDYKNAHAFYEMCNEQGIYVINKPLPNNIINDTEGRISFNQDDTLEVVNKHKNNSCIIMWELDSRVECTKNVINTINDLDSTRPVYYEGDNKIVRDQNTIQLSYDFIDKSNYIIIDQIEKEIAGKIIGNYISHNDNIHEIGLVYEDRNITPYAQEIKKEYEVIEIRPKDIVKGIFTIKNKGYSCNLTNYSFVWEILEDGIVIKQGIIPDIWIVPHSQQEITIDYSLEKILENTYYHININAITKEDNWYTSKDYCIAWSQFSIPYKLPKRKQTEIYSKMRVRDRKLKVEVLGDNFEIVIDKLKGNIRSIEFDKKDYIKSPIEVYAQNGEDKISLSKVKNVIINENEREVEVEVTRKYSIKGYVKTKYIIEHDGKITIENRISSNNKHVKIGFTTKTTGEFDDFSWLGKGPYNTFHNRNDGTKVGLYYYNLHNNIEEVTPNKSGTIWAALTDCDGEGILIENSRQILFTVSPSISSNTKLAEEDEIIMDICCPSKAQHTIFDAKGKREDIYAISIKRII